MTAVEPILAGIGDKWADRPTVGKLAAYEMNPAGFVKDLIRWPSGKGPTSYQLEVLEELPVRRRVSMRGPHGLGKTAFDAWVVLWFALTRDGRDWKLPTTASAWRQLTKYLWPEVHKWSRLLDWERVGRPPFSERSELLQLSLKLRTGEAFAVASNDPSSIEGAHADHVLYLFDEAKTISGDTFDAAEGALSGEGEAFALATSTPGEPNGRFYEIQARQPGTEDWWVRHVTSDEVIAAGQMKREWAEQRARQWGVNSAVYANRVEGEFASSDEDGVIPLAWVEAANERWHAWDEAGRAGDFAAVGVDVARSGDDSTVMAERHGNAVAPLRRSSREDTTQTTSRVQAILARHGRGRAVIDVIGIGAGVFDQLRQDHPKGTSVEAFNASERTSRKDQSGEWGFVNSRAAAWWHMRELLDPANTHDVALPPDDLLTGDLTAPRWWVAAGARIQVESKDDIRKRIGRSTDSGDAVIQAFWSESRPGRVRGSALRTQLPSITGGSR